MHITQHHLLFQPGQSRLGGGSELQDGEEVGEVVPVPEHVAGAGNGVQARPPWQDFGARIDGGSDLFASGRDVEGALELKALGTFLDNISASPLQEILSKPTPKYQMMDMVPPLGALRLLAK